ncbi:adenosylhomocysteinase [Rhizobium leguminosarum bv. viciae]|uniref:adenosylhomocysteinase n=1 Tax=Rhizobium leguminosarum TaxID=384 RepID=UPI0014427982|nr:adenosylhomocysteinase [Rhizobium leguminosarum]NKK87480.1 adenosylhomocysteinase [Rhizobium leguminosarum bv. viciae]
MNDVTIAPEQEIESGRRKIEWARAHMPILAGIKSRFEQELPFKGRRIGICLHVEAKTGVWLDALTAGGAEIIITGSPGSTQDDVAKALNAHTSITVLGSKADSRDVHDDHCREVLRSYPDIIADNGADLLTLLATEAEFEALRDTIRGSTEETTTGAFRLRENNIDLGFATWVINDTQAKRIVENRYGVGSSVVDGVMRATNVMLHGKTVVVVGYGYCGSGVAQRLRGMGAHVTVVERDPMRRLEAHLEGFRTADLDDCLRQAQILITVTGRDGALTFGAIEQLRDGCILANAGHFSSEIEVGALEQAAVAITDCRDGVKEYRLASGKRVFLITDGNLVNLAAGDGNPIEIMDLGLALQSLSLEQMALFGRSVPVGVHPVSQKIEHDVCSLALSAWV